MESDHPGWTDQESKIAVVDDREENRALLRYLFGPPFTVLEAADGVEALALIEREMPDCVLLDLELPKLSGLVVLERIMADPRLRDIPVVIVTATDATAETMERALRTGAIDYITKPIVLPLVRARVRGAIERRRLLRDVQRLPVWLPPGVVPGLRAHLDEIATYADLLQHSTDAPEDLRRTFVARIHEGCRQVIARTGEFLEANDAPGRSVEDLARLFAPGAGGQEIAPALRWQDSPSHGDAPQGNLGVVVKHALANALTFRATGGRV